jgi:hypothetical protein
MHIFIYIYRFENANFKKINKFPNPNLEENNLGIFVVVVFDNNIVLTNDSFGMRGFNKV